MNTPQYPRTNRMILTSLSLAALAATVLTSREVGEYFRPVPEPRHESQQFVQLPLVSRSTDDLEHTRVVLGIGDRHGQRATSRPSTGHLARGGEVVPSSLTRPNATWRRRLRLLVQTRTEKTQQHQIRRILNKSSLASVTPT